jgi:hypothetical protein
MLLHSLCALQRSENRVVICCALQIRIFTIFLSLFSLEYVWCAWVNAINVWFSLRGSIVFVLFGGHLMHRYCSRPSLTLAWQPALHGSQLVIWELILFSYFVTFTWLCIVWQCIVTNFFVIRPTNFTNLFCHETLHVSDSSSVHHQELVTVHPTVVYVIQLSSRTRMELQFHPGPARQLSTNLYDIYHC